MTGLNVYITYVLYIYSILEMPAATEKRLRTLGRVLKRCKAWNNVFNRKHKISSRSYFFIKILGQFYDAWKRVLWWYPHAALIIVPHIPRNNPEFCIKKEKYDNYITFRRTKNIYILRHTRNVLKLPFSYAKFRVVSGNMRYIFLIWMRLVSCYVPFRI